MAAPAILLSPHWMGRLKPLPHTAHYNGSADKIAMTIRILVTGGTFDKEYDELTGRLYFRDTHLPEMLRRGRCRCSTSRSRPP